MELVFSQLRELELVRFGKGGNPHQATFSLTECQFILVLANYNQHSTRLKTALTGIDEKNLPFKLLFATSSFMGYGLYEESIVPLGQFKKLLK
jgi:hypothetical protein